MLFLVTCVYDEGVYEADFRVVEAASRLAVGQHIVDNPGFWSDFLRNAHLYDPIVRGDMPYYADPQPVTAEEALALIDASGVDGDSRAKMSIYPITDILTIPVSEPQTQQTVESDIPVVARTRMPFDMENIVVVRSVPVDPANLQRLDR